MKVVILAGGFGTRLSEETETKPKAMIEIGGKPILWHILKNYSHYGFNDFVICLGYRGTMIKQYFYNYFLNNSDFTINLENGSFEIYKNCKETWKITLIDTGQTTMTGGRIKKIREFVNSTFMLTYGDGLSDINLNDLLEFHRHNKKIVTMTTVFIEGRFGYVTLNEKDQVVTFREKSKSDGNWINAGFFVCEPEIFDLIEGDQTVFEKEPLEKLASMEELSAYRHKGFWKCMDSQKDWLEFQELWIQNPLWKIWK